MGSRSLLALGGFLAASFGAAAFGAYVTNRSVDSWYPTLEKPAWRPPNAAFGPVWTVLYTLMALAAWLVWRADDSTASTHTARKRALAAWGIQLALNAAWSAVFFGARSPAVGWRSSPPWSPPSPRRLCWPGGSRRRRGCSWCLTWRGPRLPPP